MINFDNYIKFLSTKFDEYIVNEKKLNDKYKIYYTLNIYIDKEILYKTIIEIGNREDYKFISRLS